MEEKVKTLQNDLDSLNPRQKINQVIFGLSNFFASLIIFKYSKFIGKLEKIHLKKSLLFILAIKSYDRFIDHTFRKYKLCNTFSYRILTVVKHFIIANMIYQNL